MDSNVKNKKINCQNRRQIRIIGQEEESLKKKKKKKSYLKKKKRITNMRQDLV